MKNFIKFDNVEIHFIYPFRIENWNNTKKIIRDELEWALDSLKDLILDDSQRGKKEGEVVCRYINRKLRRKERRDRYSYIDLLLGKPYIRKYFSECNDLKTLKDAYDKLSSDMDYFDFLFLNIVLSEFDMYKRLENESDIKIKEILHERINRESNAVIRKIVNDLKKSTEVRRYEESELSPHMRLPNPHIIMNSCSDITQTIILDDSRKIKVKLHHAVKVFSSGYGTLKVMIVPSEEELSKDHPWEVGDISRLIRSVEGRKKRTKKNFVLNEHFGKLAKELFNERLILKEGDLRWCIKNILDWYTNTDVKKEDITKFCDDITRVKTTSEKEIIIDKLVRDDSSSTRFTGKKYKVDDVLRRRYKKDMRKMVDAFKGFENDEFYKRGEDIGIIFPYPVIVLSGKPLNIKSSEQNPCGCKPLGNEHVNELYQVLLSPLDDLVKKELTDEDRRRCENLFYSDCIRVFVHPRSTVIFHQPKNKNYESSCANYSFQEYKSGILNLMEILRIQWFCYLRTISKMREYMYLFSIQFSKSDETVRKGRFEEVGTESEYIVEETNNIKNEISSLVELPSMKVSNSSFPDIMKRGIEEFDLDELYEHIRERQQRLDMLCSHAMDFLHEYSGLHVEDRIHATDLALEFLEAAVVGFGVAEIAHYTGFFKDIPVILYIPLILGSGLMVYPIIAWIREHHRTLHGPRSERVHEQKVERLIGIIGAYLLILTLFAKFYSLQELEIIFALAMVYPLMIVLRNRYRI